MLHFGNLDNIKNASLKELKEIKNIPYKILKDTYDFFNNQLFILNLMNYEF